MGKDTQAQMAKVVDLFVEEMLVQSQKASKTTLNPVKIDDLERILPRLLMDWN